MYRSEGNMSKRIKVSFSQLLQSQGESDADLAFAKVLDVMDQHGVCYCRFTKEDGVQIINPRYNQRISGAIADA
jgi:hypothetical protein